MSLLAALALIVSLLSTPLANAAPPDPGDGYTHATCDMALGSQPANCILESDMDPGSIPNIPPLSPVTPLAGFPGVYTQDLTVVPVTSYPLCANVGVTEGSRCADATSRILVEYAGQDLQPWFPVAVESISHASDPTKGCSPGESCRIRFKFQPANMPGPMTLTVKIGATWKSLNPDRPPFTTNPNQLYLWGWDEYSTLITIDAATSAAPIPSFTSFEEPTSPGTFVLTATSVDPAGLPMTHSWQFDDGTSATGSPLVHTFNQPGEHPVQLTSTNTNARSASTTQSVTVAAPTLGVGIQLLDGAAPPLDPDQPLRLAVTVSASYQGVGAIEGIHFDQDTLVRITPTDRFVLVSGPSPAVPTGGFDLQPGEQRTFEMTVKPTTVGTYTLLTGVSGTDGTGTVQKSSDSSPGEIGRALAMTLEVDPPFADQVDGPDGPEPIDATVTLTFENTTSMAMDAVTLTSLRVDRVVVGQPLAVTQTGGVEPGDNGLVIGSLAPGEKKSVTATFRADDDAEVEFSAMATAHFADGRTEIGAAHTRWSVRPDKLLQVRTRVTNPVGGSMLPAGELVRIEGTVKNMSNTASIEVGPLYPTLTGNAGAMSFSWSTAGTDPKDMIPGTSTVLGPAESRDFSVRFLTGWSDPRAVDGPRNSGGTRASATFTPWGIATLEDGTTTNVIGDLLDVREQDLVHNVRIDDSIEIPTFSYAAWGGAVMVGAADGVWSGTAAFISSLDDLVTLPYTVISGTMAMQEQVWSSFTEEEREAFANDTALMAAAVLARNFELGKQGTEQLYQQAKESTLIAMTEMANNWEVGDYTDTTQLLTRYASDAVTQAVLPVALGKLVKSTGAVAALERAQTAIQNRMASIFVDASKATRIQELGPILTALENGTELLPEQLATLYGISTAEYTELKGIAQDLNVLLTVRSRHGSSIKWIEEAKAMLKPETLKIKTVSELDARLGYRATDVGSLVFRKPEVLRAFEAGEGDLGALINDFVIDRGFEPGTTEWANAVNRVMARTTEWRKWEKYYKRWDNQGWIDVSMNYEGNAIMDPVRKGKSNLGVAPLESGKYAGFRMRSIGEDEYVLEMMNNKVGRFVPITGDIDPIAFTHLDGSPLTMEEHAVLLDKMASNPLLATQHGESATFTKGGVDFIQSQFKPNEPGLQIAPGDHLPRVVRLDTDPGRSVWNSPFDYHLRWKGGFIYSGSYVPKGAIPQPAYHLPPTTEPLPMQPRVIPQATTPEPNVGRCRITYEATKTAIEGIMDIHGKLVQLAGDRKSTTESTLQSECFSEGPVIERAVRPLTGLLLDAAAGDTELDIPDDQFLAVAGTGLQVGDEVTIGVGTPDAETHTIVGFGSIIIDKELQHSWPAGTLIMVVHRQPQSEEPPSTTTTIPGGSTTSTPPGTTPTSQTRPSDGTSNPATGGGSNGTPGQAAAGVQVAGARVERDHSEGKGSSALAYTGSNDIALVWLAIVLLTVGLSTKATRKTYRRNRS